MFSSAISDTDTALAAQYNNLRLDIFDQTSGHDHDGTSSGGKKVSHSDLVDDAAIPNTYLSHATLSKHVQGTGGTSTDPDADGGDSGVHGLATGVKVAGSLGGSQLIIDVGSEAAAASGTVTFNSGFSSAPKVAIAVVMSSGLPADQGVRIYNITTSGFSFSTSGTVAFDWIAVGT